jgi:hypothetical protein
MHYVFKTHFIFFRPEFTWGEVDRVPRRRIVVLCAAAAVTDLARGDKIKANFLHKRYK